MLSHYRSLRSEGKSTFASRQALQFFRLQTLPTSLGSSLVTSPFFSFHSSFPSCYLDNSMTSLIPFLDTLENILQKVTSGLKSQTSSIRCLMSSLVSILLFSFQTLVQEHFLPELVWRLRRTCWQAFAELNKSANMLFKMLKLQIIYQN